MAWAALTNGELLAAAEGAGFDVMVSGDKNLVYQQNLAGRKLALVVLGTNSWKRIKLDTARWLRCSAARHREAFSWWARKSSGRGKPIALRNHEQCRSMRSGSGYVFPHRRTIGGISAGVAELVPLVGDRRGLPARTASAIEGRARAALSIAAALALSGRDLAQAGRVTRRATPRISRPVGAMCPDRSSRHITKVSLLRGGLQAGL